MTLSTVFLLPTWREVQNVCNKKKKEEKDSLTASTLHFILVTFLTWDDLL